MLYLEDYLEMIEHLPQELRDRFTEMREMDLAVQNNSDTLAKRAKALFTQCRHNELSTDEADSEFANIRNEYYRVLEDADEKVQLAGQMYDLVDRYLRRLDTELYKFKCELEADHNGITEILEKRSLELDNTTSNGNTIQKENRFYDAHGPITPSSANRVDSRHKVKSEKRRNSHASSGFGSFEKRVAATSTPLSIGPSPAGSNSSSSTITTPNVLNPSPGGSVAYNLQTFGAGNAIAAAASQAIAQTQQMQQGRRTASLKASYEAIGAAGSHELLINSELAGATHNAIQAVERESNAFSNQRRQKKKNPNNTVSTGALQMQQPLNPQPAPLHQPTTLLPQQQQSIQLEQATTQHQQLLPTHQHQPQLATNVSTVPSSVGSAVQLQVQPHSKATSHNMPLPHSTQMQQLSLQQQQLLQKAQPLTQGQLPQQPPQLQQQQMKQQSRNLSQQHQLTQPHTVGESLTQSLTQPLPQIRKLPYVPGTAPAKPHQLRQELQQQLLRQQKQIKIPGGPLESESSSLVPQQQSQLSQQQVPNPPQQHLHVQLAQPHVKLQQKPHKQQPIQFQPQQQQQTSNLSSVQSSLTQTQQHLPQTVHQVQQNSQPQMQPISNQQHLPLTQQQQQLKPHHMVKDGKEYFIVQSRALQHQQRVIAVALPKHLQTQHVKKQEQQLQQQHIHQNISQLGCTSSSYQTQQQQQSSTHLLQPQTQQLAMQQQQSVQVGQNLQEQQPHDQIVQPQQQQVAQTSHSITSTAYSQMQQLPSPSTSQLQQHQAVGQTSLLGQQSSGLSSMSSIDTLDPMASASLETIDSGIPLEPESEWSYDPNEPRYCICNQVSYGDMVACDNEGCPFEWFHYPCVNITSSPKGKWYCPQCSTSMKRRGSRKN
ncbi:bromodomain-containing protein DDB_G0280777-like isoform X2 [Anopheles darlingi]|uniref:bromodomain-containing protein DDB_G0280777-like isoform X2 n=1 Tax=Anopheles darlingi TaxID=43151 RepID=UPI0020FFF7A5|nr:bromodomain-containing protein DDB_G0280777-like isoform X2 [Anopheles darlingi]